MRLCLTRVLAALVLMFLILPVGCAQKPPETAVPPQTAPGPGAPAPHDDTWASAPPAKAPAPTQIKAERFSTVRSLLSGAGRNPNAPQPEAGFVLEAPDTADTGKPFLIRVGYVGLERARVEWRGRTLELAPDARGVCEALLAVPLTEKSRELPLSLTLMASGKTETLRAEIPVRDPAYPVQRLKVNPKFVNPPKSELERIKLEQQAVREAVTQVSAERYWQVPMLRPVPGVVTSVYGLRRVFNGEERGRHRGVDFDGHTGEPVEAVDTGIVVLSDAHYYGGNTVIVDHGLGVFSMYLHLSHINVAVGQKISRGETVGLIGATGRVTGPHLHLSMYVAGDSVDAAPLLKM